MRGTDSILSQDEQTKREARVAGPMNCFAVPEVARQEAMFTTRCGKIVRREVHWKNCCWAKDQVRLLNAMLLIEQIGRTPFFEFLQIGGPHLADFRQTLAGANRIHSGTMP